MAGAAIGALLGMAFGSTLAGWGLVAHAGLGWMLGASVGSLFDQPSLDFGSGNTSPNYSFGEIANTKSQLLPVPVVYGRCRVAGNIFLQKFYDDKKEKMDLFVGLSQGPINRIISVYANEHVLYGDGSGTQSYWIVENGDWREATYQEYLAYEGPKEIRDSEGNPATVNLEECSCDIHLGDPYQAIDPREPGAWTYPYTAFLGITLKVQEGLSGNPVITTELEGRKIWTPAGTRYSNNPVWCIWDLITNTRYGAGIPAETLNLEAAKDAAAYCDELVDGHPRYTLNYIVDRQRPAPDTIRDMLMCFNGYTIERESIEIRASKMAQTPTHTLDLDQDAIMDTATWWCKSREERYNRITVEWVDPNNYYERSTMPLEDQADIQARGVYERNVSLLGITDARQAARIGERMLLSAQRINNFCSFGLSVKDWDIEVGDVISISWDIPGWSDKRFNVLQIETDAEAEEATYTCVEHDPATYVDTPTVIPDTPSNPPPPGASDNYSNLLLTDVGDQQADGTHVPKIRVRYTPPVAEMAEHVINWWHGLDTGAKAGRTLPASVTDALIAEGIRTGETLTVHVWGTDVNGRRRSGVIGQIVPGRDNVAPNPPTNLTATGWFGEILLDWVNPETNEDGTPCTDLSHIEVWESSEDDIETSVLVGKVNGTHFQRHLGSFEGRYYWVRAVDTSGNMSQWNAEAGTFGYSEEESHEDFINALLEQNPLIQDLWDSLGTEVDGISEERIQDMLGSLDQFYLLMFQKRQAEKDAEALIEEALGNYEDMKYSVAIVNEEKITRESEDEALAQSIEVVGAMIGDPNNPGPDTVWAGIYEEKTARATADEAMAGHILDISAGIGDPLNPEDGTVYAAIREEAIARVSGDEASATEINTLYSQLGTANAAIQNESITRADQDSALSAEINTLYSQLGTTNAAIQNEAITRAAQDSALSAQINTVQNTVGENTTKIQQQSTVIDGIKGEWTIKIDSNGSVAGIGLINGPTGSAFIVRSDSFWIGRPGTTIKEAPFVVGTVDGLTKVSMSNAFIQDAAISSAKIKDLTIGRIKLASGIYAGLSWGNSSYYGGDQSRSGSGIFTPAGGSCSIRTESRGRVMVSGFVSARHWNGTIHVYLKRGGTTVRHLGSYGGGTYDPIRTFFAFYVDEYPGNGIQTYSISISYSGEATYVHGCGLSVMAFYR